MWGYNVSKVYTDIIGHFALGTVLIHVIKLFLIGEEVKEGDIRIGSYGQAWRGIVEIYLSGAWGTVYYDGASTEEAAWVVCRQLGYHTYGI